MNCSSRFLTSQIHDTLKFFVGQTSLSAKLLIPNMTVQYTPQPLEEGLNGTHKPRVDRFDSATATIEEMTASMTRNGGVIIRNFLPMGTISAIESEVWPYLEGDTPWEGNTFPPQTRRVTGALAKSTTFRERLIMQPQFLALCDAMLSVTSKAWFGDVCNEITARAQIGGSIVFCVNPGAQAQPLHRDDMQHHRRSPKITADEYEPGRDAGISLFVAGCKLTKANGATRFCPGSHLEKSDTPPNEANAFYAEMDAGDALVMLSSCYHGGSANTTTNEERLVFSAIAHKGYLRQVCTCHVHRTQRNS
jgi:ectoine hydroxylase-related dioxygenase (phytanoyl-CoA dioxygenase family)